MTNEFAIEYIMEGCESCPEYKDGECLSSSHCFEVKQYAIQAIQALESQQWIPKNPTNGDMIISLYPNLKYYVKGDRVMTTIGVASSFDLDWWNAPYREGDAE